MLNNEDFQESNLNEALDKFENSLRTNTNLFFDSEELEEIIEHYIFSDNLKLATQAVNKGQELYPYDSYYAQKRAQILTLQGKIEEGIKLLKKSLENDPANTETLLMIGEIYERQKEYKTALHFYLKTQKSEENLSEILLCIGNCYLQTSQTKRALHFFDRAAKNKELNEHILGDIHFCFDEAKKTQEGIAFFNGIIDCSPYNFSAWYFLGLLYQAGKKTNLALKAYDYCLVIHDSYMPAYYNSAVLLFEEKNFKQAIKYFNLCLKHGGDDGLIRTDLAACYEQKNRMVEAQKQYRKAIELDEFLSEAWFGLGLSIINNQNNYAEAIPFLEKAFELDGNDQEYAFRLAEAYCYQNRIDQSIEIFRQFVINNSDNWFAWTQLAKYQIIDSQYQEASDTLEKALQYLPENASVLYHLSAAKFILGENQKALDALTLALKINPSKLEILFEIAPFLTHNTAVQDLIDIYQ